MSKHNSLGCGGGARWGGVALALAFGVVQVGCGNASKKECDESVIASFTGECPGGDGDSNGGEGGTGNTGAGGADGAGTTANPDDGGSGGTLQTTPKPKIVFQWGDAEHEGSLSWGDWQVGNTKGFHDGKNAVNAPALPPAGEASMTFDCGGQEHTQLSFFALRLTGNTELELFDGVTSRGIIVGDGGWNSFVFDVPPGKHEYTFTARNKGSAELAAPFVLDTFVCKNAEPTKGPNGIVNLDAGFIPVEIAGDWFVDNLRGTHMGEAAVHAPPLEPKGEASMTFDCGDKAHTQLKFIALRQTGNTELELFDGEISRGIIVGDGGWNAFAFDVPAGKHQYTFTARNTGSAELAPPFVIDSFECNSEEPAPGPNGVVNFDAGFIPIEIGGEWFVDNRRGVHMGEAAVHPPALDPGKEAAMTFDCVDPGHTKLSFLALRLTGSTELEIFDGGKSRDKYVGDGGWNAPSYEGEPGARQYTFVARNTGSTRIDSPFVIDTVSCE